MLLTRDVDGERGWSGGQEKALGIGFLSAFQNCFGLSDEVAFFGVELVRRRRLRRSKERRGSAGLVREKIGVLGMKPLGSGAILQSGKVKAIECLHYALNLPTSTVITAMESMARLEQALEAVRTFNPMDAAAVK